MRSPFQHPSRERVLSAWYPVALSSELQAKPLRVRLFDVPVVLFRASSERNKTSAPYPLFRNSASSLSTEVAGLIDRCPHRNAPLSLGRIVNNTIECPYHGWKFDRDGSCVDIPGRLEHEARTSYCAAALQVAESDGIVWLHPGPQATDAQYRLPTETNHYAQVTARLTMPGTVLAVAENALDVPHTAVLHRGLFRGTRGTPLDIEVVVRESGGTLEAEYIGESKPEGLLGRVLAPGATGAVSHFDRFIAPSTAQVEYRLGETHVLATAFLTPTSDEPGSEETELLGVVRVKSPVAPKVIAETALRALLPLGRLVLGQDRKILRAQQDGRRMFPRSKEVSTELDALGPAIAKMLHRLANGEELPTAKERRFRMRVGSITASVGTNRNRPQVP